MAEGRIQGRRTGFFVTGVGEELRLVECETFSCGHCQHVTHVAHGSQLFDIGSFCRACMRPVCKQCTKELADGGACDPYEKKIERGERAVRGSDIARFSTEIEQKINAQLERARFLGQLEQERRA